MQALLDIRMLRKQVEGPGESIRCCLVPGKHEGEDLVVQLMIIHTFACLCIAQMQEHRKKVFLVLAVPTARANDRIHYVAQLLTCPPVAPVARRGNTQRYPG